MFKFITPFNVLVVAVILTATYAGWLTYENFSLRQNLEQAAPGHELKAKQKADLDVVMFYDYSCPFCLAMDPTIHNAAALDGKVNLRYKFLPILSERSERAGRLAFAAGKQEAFLKVHEYIVKHPENPFEAEDIEQVAMELDLDYAQLTQDMESEDADQVLKDNVSLMGKMNIYSTPTFVINNRPYIPFDGMPDEAKFLEVFEKARNSEPFS